MAQYICCFPFNTPECRKDIAPLIQTNQTTYFHISCLNDWNCFTASDYKYADRIRRKISMEKIICSGSLFRLWLKGRNENSWRLEA